MPYPELLIAPMRSDLTRYGIEELRTPEQVDSAVAPNSGTVLLVINSVCGCAAGKARPGVGMALNHPNRPDRAVSVFAGADIAAVQRVRELLADFPPSSPSVALFRDGRPVFMLHRHEIEGSHAAGIASVLTRAFDQYCVPANR